MKIKTRWIESIIETAATLDTPLPWERGAGRDERIARRDNTACAAERLSA